MAVGLTCYKSGYIEFICITPKSQIKQFRQWNSLMQAKKNSFMRTIIGIFESCHRREKEFHGLQRCLIARLSFKGFFSPSTLVWQFYSQPLKMWVKGSSGARGQRQRNKSWEQKVVLKFGRKALAPVYSGTNSKCGVQGRAWSHVLSKPSLFRRGILTYLSASQHPLTFRLQPCVRYSPNYSMAFRQYSLYIALKEENKTSFSQKSNSFIQ